MNRTRSGRTAIPAGGLTTDPARNGYQLHHYLFMVVGWAVILAVAVVLVRRWGPVEDVVWIGIVGLTPFLFLPLIGAGIMAWLSRSILLRVGVAAVTAVYVFTVAPVDAVVGCGAEAPGDGDVTIMTANVLYNGGGRAAFVAESIAAHDPDIVVLQETGRDFVAILAADPAMAPYQARSNDLPGAPSGSVVWSRWPIVDPAFDRIDVVSSVTVTIDGPPGQFEVSAVHTTSPVSPSDVARWHRQFESMEQYPVDRPAVLAGDFNATEDHQPFRELLTRGWTDVHNDKGCGLDATWPTRKSPLAVYRLDHVLVTDHFDVVSTELGDPAGSDHRPVITTIRLSSGDRPSGS